jgi:hypothetical protein
MAGAGVEIEVERDEDQVVLSLRNGAINFVLTLPLDGATVLSASMVRATDEESTENRQRFTISRARLEGTK